MQLKSRKDNNLYALLDGQATVAVKAAEQFLAMTRDFGNLQHYADVLDKLEDDGDDLTHKLQDLIAATFITPLDKEDLKELSSALDDVLDYIEAAAARAALYKLKEPREELIAMAELLLQVTLLTQKAVATMRDGFRRTKELESMLRDIHTVENESDQVFRKALGTLFDEPGIDPLLVIKWKEMFDRIETAVDKCEHIAAIIGTILVKYA
jgi:uncharacterized protein